MKRVGIAGVGEYLPRKVLTNADLEKMVDTSDEWITTRTGIKERRIAAKNEACSDLAVNAAKDALRDAGLKAQDVELIIVATVTPDSAFPSVSCLVQHAIGAAGAACLDVSAACARFVYALVTAQQFIARGTYKNALVIGVDKFTNLIDWKDRGTCVLFGDGAGAAVVSRSKDGHGILASYLGADGNQSEILQIPAGGSKIPPSAESVANGQHFIRMDGPALFKIAVKTMEQAVRKVLEHERLEVKDINCLIPHQANNRILQAVAERLKIAPEKVFINVDRYGNMSSASTVIGLYEAVKTGAVKKGDYVVLVAFGGGLTWGASLIKW